MTNKNTKTVLMVAGLFAPLIASATPPWFVDWAHTVAFQNLATRIYYYSNQVGSTRTQNIPKVQLAYGVSKNLEVNVKFDEFLKTTSGPTYHGFDDTVLGMKYRFYTSEPDTETSKKGTELGVGYQYTLRTGDAGISGNANPQTPYLMANTYIGKLGLYADFGETFPDVHTVQQDAYGGFLGTYELDDRWLLIGEVYGNTATKSGTREDLEYAAGFHYQATKDVRYFGRFGHSVEGYSDFNVTLGVQILFKGQ